ARTSNVVGCVADAGALGQRQRQVQRGSGLGRGLIVERGGITPAGDGTRSGGFRLRCSAGGSHHTSAPAREARPRLRGRPLAVAGWPTPHSCELPAAVLFHATTWERGEARQDTKRTGVPASQQNSLLRQ